MRGNSLLLCIVLCSCILPLYHAEARYYDARAGRWMSVDPLAEKYTGWSPYHYSGDRPTLLIDPNGREWKIGGDMGIVKRDVEQLVGTSNMKYVSIADNGNVTLAKGFNSSSNAGSQLVSNMVNANESFEYQAATSVDVVFQTGPQAGTEVTRTLGGTNPADNFLSAVKGGRQFETVVEGETRSGMVGFAPKSGDALVAISPAYQFKMDPSGTPVERTHIVFHELMEAYVMVKQKLPRFSDPGKDSADEQAGKAGTKRAANEGLNPTGANGVLRDKP